MDVLSEKEIDAVISDSLLVDKYNEVVDRESAYEILSAKIEDAKTEEHKEEQTKRSGRSRKKEKSTMEEVLSSTTTRQVGRTVARELTRGLLGVLGVPTTRRRSRRRKSSWF